METSEITYKQPPQLFDDTQKVIAQLESKLNAPLLCYWNATRGGVCANDVLALHEVLRHLNEVETANL